MDRTLTRLLARATACCGSLTLAAAVGSARAEDIDIYMSVPSSGDLPNILFVLDNSANWSSNLPIPPCKYKNVPEGEPDGPPSDEQSKKIGLEKCALHNVIDALGQSDVPIARLGLMLFNESPASISGGYPRIAFTEVTSATRETLKAKIRAIRINDDKGNNAAFAKSLHEVFLYFGGKAPYVGASGKEFDPDAFDGGRYRSPAASTCSRNYVVFIGNGRPGESTDNEARVLLAGVGGDTTPIPYPTSIVTKSDQGNWADEYARFMADADVSGKGGTQAITTYTVAVTGASSDGIYPNFLRGMANQGGGRFYEAKTPEGLEKYLLDLITREIAAVDSAFVSASLPVSVNSRGTYLNQIFMGLFRPDGDAAPRWRGNLKQYKFNYDTVTSSLYLADSLSEPAINPATGFFLPTAVSYWTADEDPDYWIHEPMGTPRNSSDRPDGEVVEKGGAAQRLRVKYPTNLDARKVYTCLSCAAGTALGDSDATRFAIANTDLTAAKLGVDAATRDLLIDWVRGFDNAGDERDGDGGEPLVRPRPSIHGDVLHSRPVVVNYGGEPPHVVVFYGANDGMLHAINGNQTGGAAGEEYWSFVAEEGLDKLNRLRANTPPVRFTNTPEALIPETAPRDYFFDGPLSFYQKLKDDGTSDKVYLYAGMRRGGRALYAFDVTDPTEPKFMWKRTSSTIPALGQTWSEARVAKIKGHSNPVLVLGAGYDPVAEDVDPPAAATMGKAVLVLDAVTGALLKQFTTSRPVVADVSLVDSDYDGLIDRGYVADLGGKVYRLDFEKATATGVSSALADWKLTTFADLSASGGNKFFYAPDVVQTRDFAVVLIGSGDREKPLDDATSEKFYTLIDKEIGKGVSAGFVPIAYSELVSQAAFTSPATQRGCFIPMAADGEKVVNAPVTTGGVTYFSTNRPTPPGDSCTGSLGEAKVYGVPLVCKAPESQVLNGGGLPPSPVTGNVAINLGTAPDGTPIIRRVPFIIGGFNVKRSGIEGSKVPIVVPPRRNRLYWFPETER